MGEHLQRVPFSKHRLFFIQTTATVMAVTNMEKILQSPPPISHQSSVKTKPKPRAKHLRLKHTR